MTREYALDLLGLSGNPSEDEIKKAYRTLAKKVHPDMGGNSALFRLIDEAYGYLTGSDTQPSGPKQEQPQQEPSPKRPEPNRSRPTWLELVTHPEFVLPFQTLYQIARTGQTRTVLFQNRAVAIQLEDLLAYPIKCDFPIRVEVYTWKSWFHWFFKRKPVSKGKRDMTVRNMASKNRGGGEAYLFQSSINVHVKHGFQLVKFKFLDREVRIKGSTRLKPEIQREFQLESDGRLPLKIRIDARVSV